MNTTDDDTTNDVNDDASTDEYHHERGIGDEPAGPGMRVRDRTGESKLRVIADTDTRADEWEVAATGRTVADHNPEFPENSPVLIAVYESTLDETFGMGWRNYTPSLLSFKVGDLGATCYSFPAHRLAVIEDDWPPESEGEQDTLTDDPAEQGDDDDK